MIEAARTAIDLLEISRSLKTLSRYSPKIMLAAIKARLTDCCAPLILLGAISITDLLQIIYSSQPFGYDEATLNGVLLDARRCNSRDGVTGALVCRQDIYLQMLEGPEEAVQGAFERIKRDDRHLDVTLQVSEPVTLRMFGQWAMLHDPARSWIWSQREVSEGALERAKPADFTAVFEKLASKVRAGSPD